MGKWTGVLGKAEWGGGWLVFKTMTISAERPLWYSKGEEEKEKNVGLLPTSWSHLPFFCCFGDYKYRSTSPCPGLAYGMLEVHETLPHMPSSVRLGWFLHCCFALFTVQFSERGCAGLKRLWHGRSEDSCSKNSFTWHSCHLAILPAC